MFSVPDKKYKSFLDFIFYSLIRTGNSKHTLQKRSLNKYSNHPNKIQSSFQMVQLFESSENQTKKFRFQSYSVQKIDILILALKWSGLQIASENQKKYGFWIVGPSAYWYSICQVFRWIWYSGVLYSDGYCNLFYKERDISQKKKWKSMKFFCTKSWKLFIFWCLEVWPRWRSPGTSCGSWRWARKQPWWLCLKKKFFFCKNIPFSAA